MVEALEPDGDSALVVALRVGEARISARITRRAAGLLALAPGVPCHAIIKAMATEEAGAG